MPVDAGDIAVLIRQLQPTLDTVVDGDQPERETGVIGAGERIAMLLDLDLRLGLVHDRIGRNVRLVELLEGDPLARWRRPVTAQPIEVLLGDVLGEPAGGTEWVRCKPPLAVLIDRPHIALPSKKRPAAVGSDLRIDHAATGKPRARAVRPAVELARYRQQHDVGLLSPDVVGDAGFPQSEALAPQRFFQRQVRLRRRFGWR